MSSLAGKTSRRSGPARYKPGGRKPFRFRHLGRALAQTRSTLMATYLHEVVQTRGVCPPHTSAGCLKRLHEGHQDSRFQRATLLTLKGFATRRSLQRYQGPGTSGCER